MPTVEPIQVPNQPLLVARVTVASIVLSPNSARKNAIATAKKTERLTLDAFSFSASVTRSR